MAAVQGIGGVLDPQRQRVQPAAALERPGAVQAQDGRVVGRLLARVHAVLGRVQHDRGPSLPGALLIPAAQLRPHRRDARQRGTVVDEPRADVVEAEFREHLRGDLRLRPRFDACQHAVPGGEAHLGIPLDGPPRGLAEDEVRDGVPEHRHFARCAGQPPPQRAIDAEGAFGLEVLIAHLVGVVPDMQAVEVELFECRAARGAREAGGQRHGAGRAPDHPARERDVAEITRPPLALRPVRGELRADAPLERHGVPGHLLEHEQRPRADIDWRRQGFLTRGAEAARQERPAPGAGHAAHGAMGHEEIAFGLRVLEAGPREAVFELVVTIVAVGERRPQRRRQAAERAAFRPGGQAVAARRQLDAAAIERRHAVVRPVVAVGRADVALGAHPRQAHRPLAAGHRGVVDRALGRPHVPRLAPGPADVPHQRPRGPPVRRRDAALRRARPAVHRHGAARARAGALAGPDLRHDRVGDDVHQPADRIGPVEERGRPADDLDLRRCGGVDRDAVVRRLARHVAHAVRVLEDEHAIAVEAADDRPGGPGARRPLGDARLRLERGAKRALQLAAQILPRQHRDRLSGGKRAAVLGLDRDGLGELQNRIDREIHRTHAGRDPHVVPGGHEPIRRGREGIRAWRHAVDRERPVELCPG